MIFNPQETKDDLVQWIRKYFADNGPMCSAVVGISGGKDSTIVAALCVEALGKDRVIGVLMPNGVQNDIDDSFSVVNSLGIRNIKVNIGAAYKELVEAVDGALNESVSTQTRVNLPHDSAWQRYMRLLNHCQTEGALLILAICPRTMWDTPQSSVTVQVILVRLLTSQ